MHPLKTSFGPTEVWEQLLVLVSGFSLKPY